MTDPREDDAEALGRLAEYLTRLGAHSLQQKDDLGALRRFSQALDIDPSHELAARYGTAILERVRVSKANPALVRVILQCLLSPYGNVEALTRAAADQLRLIHGDGADPMDWALDPLARVFLTRCINTDLELEGRLTALRSKLATMLIQGETPEPLMDLAEALALQAFANEYVWAETDADLAAIERTKRSPNLSQTLAYAMYRPLDPANDRLAKLLEAGGHTLLKRRSLDDVAAERALAADLPSMTELEDETSQAVREMYETTPYPRWLPGAPALGGDPWTVLRARFPWAEDLPKPGAPARILMPGAGSGRHPVEAAKKYPEASVTAVDLSRASLAYGQRISRNLSLENLTFHHGDILKLPETGERYDWIECLGVVHHMGDPAAGVAALAECLNPGGVLRIMVYAASRRRGINAFKAATPNWRDIGADPDLIRALRQDIVQNPARQSLLDDLGRRPDFFSRSGFRDLLFHIQEASYDAAGIRDLIAGAPLNFLGFDFTGGRIASRQTDAPQEQAYRKRFPEEKMLSNLDNWVALEEAGAADFSNYTFWCRRT